MPESSFTERYGTSFTNYPGGKGVNVFDIPGLNWEEYMTPEERQANRFPMTPGQEGAEQFPMPEVPGNLEEYLTPDYSRRDLFEQHVFKELGKNPFELNPMDALAEADKNLPEVFHHFFGGRVVWADRGKLNKEQRDAWNEVVKSYHAWVYEKANMDKAVLTDRYNFMMNQFDNNARQYEANVARIRRKREEFVTEEKEARKKAAQEAAAKLKAAQPSPLKAADLNAYSKNFESIRKEFDKTGGVSKPPLESFNSFAREHGLPELEVAKGKPQKKRIEWVAKIWPWLGDVLKPDVMEEMKLQTKAVVPARKIKQTAEKAKASQKDHGKIVRRGKTKDGRRVVQYEDGTIGYE